MAYTVTKLITEAYYLSGRLSRNLQTISGQQLRTGLSLLNNLLAMKSINERLIPYFTKYEFNTEVNVEEYMVDNLIYVETGTFNYNTVRFSMEQMSRKEYQGSARANNVTSLMQCIYVERCKGGAKLFMYFIPDAVYPVTLWGKFSLQSVVLNQDLSQTLELFYIEYLQFLLAERICLDQNITFQPQNKMKLEEYEEQMLDPSAPDLTLQKKSALVGQGASIWAVANLYGIWQPG